MAAPVELQHAVRDAQSRVARVGRRLYPAAVALAAALLIVTVLMRVAGSALLRHVSGATVLLAGLGVPVHWSLSGSGVHGTVTAAHYPAVLIASGITGVAVVVAGFAMGRGHADAGLVRIAAPASAAIGTTAVAAALVTRLTPIAIVGARVDVSASLVVSFLVAAAWGFAGSVAGVALARRVGHWAPRIRRAWAVRVPSAVMVTAAVLIVGVGACTTAPGSQTVAAERRDDSTASSTAPTTSTTVHVDATTAAAAAHAASGGTAAMRRSTTSSPSTKSAPSAAASAGAASAAWAFPGNGTYRYTTSGSTSSLLGKKAFPSVTTLTVDAPSGTKQHSTRQVVSPNGDGFVIEQTLDYRPDGIALVQQRLSLTQSGDKTVRTLNASPPTIVIPGGAAIGSHADFSLTGSTIAGREVTDIATGGPVTVGGATVQTVLVKLVLTVTGNVSGTIELDQWWAPSSRLPVKEHLNGTMKSGLATVRTTYDATLQSLSPS